MTTTDTTTTDRPLAVQAAELQGWTDLQIVEAPPTEPRIYGTPPHKDGEAFRREYVPRPDVDHGDALRFLAYTIEKHNLNVRELTMYGGDTWDCGLEHRDSNELVTCWSGGTPCLAITLACIAALTALRTEAGQTR